MANQHAERLIAPHRLTGGDWKSVGLRVKDAVSEDNLGVVAAGVAFYAFFSLFPALAALVSIYGLAADPGDVERLVQAMGGVMPDEVVQFVSAQLADLTGSSGKQLGTGAAIALLLALWGATKGTKAMITALNIAYGEQESRGFFRLNALALALTLGGVLAVMLAAVAVIVAPAVLGAVELPGPLALTIDWLRWPLLALLVIAGIGVLYRVAPSRRPATWHWLSVGAVTATALWLIASGLFSWYVSSFGSYNETFGSMAGIAILLMWFFISAFVVLLGAELNSEIEHQSGVDSTVGPDRPRGRRGAVMADRTAGEGQDRFRA